MSRYVLLGVERSRTVRLRYGTDISNIPKHLLKDNGEYVPEKYIPGYNDTISIADVNNIICNRVKVISLIRDKIEDFEYQYNIKVFIPKNIGKYGSTNLPGYQPMIIINKIGDIGCQCVDVHGNVINLKNADVLKYANTWGIANAKVYEKIGYPNSTIVISGIGWTIPVVNVEQVQKDQHNKVNATPVEKKLTNYAAKARMVGAGDFEIDTTTSTLVKCNTKKFDKLVIPPVKVIGYDAFHNLIANEVVIPQTAKIIGANAFKNAEISTLEFNGLIEKIGKDAFDNVKIKHLNLGIQELGREGRREELYKILNNKHLTTISVSPDNEELEVENNILYSKGKLDMLAYPKNKPDKVYIMPASVERMSSLREINSLEKVVLSENLERLEQEAISYCLGLKEIEIGQYIEYISDDAIYAIPKLEKVIVRSTGIRVRPGVEIHRSGHEIKVVFIEPDNKPSIKTIKADKMLQDYCKRQGWV